MISCVPQSLRATGRGSTIVNSIVATARQCNLDKDVVLPGEADDSADMTLDQRDSVVGKVYSKIMEIERYTFGCI